MTDLHFRIIYLTIAILTALIRLYWRIQYIKRNKTVKSSKRSIVEKMWVVFIFSSLVIPSVLWIFTDLLSTFQINLPIFIRIIGILGGTLSVILLFYVHQILGKNFSPILETRIDHELVILGPYKLVRHPMYTSFVIGVFSTFLLSSNLILFLSPLPGLCFILLNRVPNEEKMMLEEFGNDYIQYQKKTWKIIPYVF